MGRRIDVELTSTRDDGTWTWRAAGAKQPKGDVAAALLYDGAKVGDVVRVEADFHLDGIEVVEVFPPTAKKERTDLLELKTQPFRDDELVTTQRVARKGRGGRGERGDRRGGRRDGDRRPRRDNNGRRDRSQQPERPKAKRLRPKRVHREALLATTADEHKPIVEQLLRDGMPGVRAAIKKQNEDNVAAGRPEVEATPLLDIAEKNLAAARLAEWRDRADAALGTGDDLDLRDLRSVVVAGADVARDDETRGIVDQLKSLLDTRMESDHAQWLADLRTAVQERRVVRALRLSSRPVKAGAPLPVELANELAQQTSDSLASDTEQRRWGTVLDALAYSPVRGAVTPAGMPESPGEELIGEVRRLSDRLPAIATLFGIDPASVPKSERRGRRRRDQKPGGGKPGRDRAKKTDKPSRPVPGAEPKAERQDESSEQPVPSTTLPADEAKSDEAKAEATATDNGSQPPAAEAEVPTEPVDETPESLPEGSDDTPTDEPMVEQADSTAETASEAVEASPAGEPTDVDSAAADPAAAPPNDGSWAGDTSVGDTSVDESE